MITIVYVCGDERDDDAIVIYKDENQIGYLAPRPKYGNIQAIITAIIGEKPTILLKGQTGDDYPDTLKEMKKWPKG